MNHEYQPLITLGIPTYNRAGTTLPLTLQSALAQTYENLQVIVCDNCSQDATEAIVGGCDDDRVEYIRHTENIGANDNFNACVDHARGEYFLLLHDDDEIDKDFVQVCVDATRVAPGVGLVRTGIRMIDGGGNTILEWENRLQTTSFDGLIRGWILSDTTLFCANTLIRSDALREIGGFRSRCDLFQDVLAHVRIAARYGYVNVREVKASFRDHDQNRGSAARIDDWCKDSLQLRDTIYELLPDNKTREELVRDVTIFLCQINYSYIINLKSPLQKLSLYRRINRYFDGAFPAGAYYRLYDLAPRVRKWKKGIKKFFENTSNL